MLLLYTIFLGVIQGVLEFLPVSSLGHLSLIETMMALPKDTGLFFEAMLHLGTMLALIVVMFKDVKRLTIEFGGICSDLSGNYGKYLRKRRLAGKTGNDNIRYSKLITNVYRKIVVMILVTLIPTVILGFVCRNLAVMAHKAPSFPGFGFLIMGVFLLVVDVSGVGGDYGPNTSRYDQALWIGILQGISVFPGLSRCGLTIGTGLMCGFERKFAVKYSYLCGIPAIFGALLVEIPYFRAAAVTPFQMFAFICGALAAFTTAYFVARFLMKLMESVKLKYFAGYCFVLGALALIMSTPT